MKLLSLFICATLAISSNAHPSFNIVEGHSAEQGEIPYQVSLQFNEKHSCGGVFVVIGARQVVLTLASCFGILDVQKFKVVAGDISRSDSSGFEQIRNVRTIILHEGYNKTTGENDIAVLTLTQPFEINDNVIPIPLPYPNQQTTGNVIVSGWGTSKLIEWDSEFRPMDWYSDGLKVVQTSIVDDDTCQQTYLSAPSKTIQPSMLCSYEVESRSGSCQGDAGGPVRAVNGGYLAGIIGGAYRCGEYGHPAVNTEVSYFIDWIQNNVGPCGVH